jgi:hypothetical protein
MDLHCLTSDLPFLLRTRLDTIPAEVSYLRAPAAVPVPIKPELRVGLVWSGDARHPRDHHRSIPAALFLPIVDGLHIHCHSLQLPVRDSDLPALRARPGIARIDGASHDFADTAALIEQLDLVIAVDTAVAHLTGALGRPLWLLLPSTADWRWLTKRTDSPWYPSARLFRADTRGWLPVVKRVRQALHKRVAEHTSMAFDRRKQ